MERTGEKKQNEEMEENFKMLKRGEKEERQGRDREINEKGRKKKFEGFGVLMRLRGKKNTHGRRRVIWD